MTYSKIINTFTCLLFFIICVNSQITHGLQFRGRRILEIMCIMKTQNTFGKKQRDFGKKVKLLGKVCFRHASQRPALIVSLYLCHPVCPYLSPLIWANLTEAYPSSSVMNSWLWHTQMPFGKKVFFNNPAEFPTSPLPVIRV